MVWLGRLLAFMYISKQRDFLGFALSSWLKFIPLFFFGFGLWFKWPLPVSFTFFLLWFLLQLAYWLAGRLGFKRFIPNPLLKLAENARPVPLNQRISLKATGVFSLNDRDDYILQHPGHYWRAGLGQHIFMIQHRPGQFLYQIIKPDNVGDVRPGFLLFGYQPCPALAVTFWVTWGPEFAEYKLYYVGADNDKPAKQQRTIYLTFEDEATLQQLWRNLTPATPNS